MSIELKEIKNLKVVPQNYENATVCEISNLAEDKVEVYLPKPLGNDLDGYCKGETLEFFGLHKNGLAYFTTTILDKNDKTIFVASPNSIKEIQRRKYTRVPFEGKMTIFDVDDVKILMEDISAGGFKFLSNIAFMAGTEYRAKIEFLNNLVVECTVCPIRIEEVNESEENKYSISVKYKQIRSVDRIAIMQYSMRILAEMQNKR